MGAGGEAFSRKQQKPDGRVDGLKVTGMFRDRKSSARLLTCMTGMDRNDWRGGLRPDYILQ